MEHAVLWLKFLVAAGSVVVAGLNLTRHAERLAEAMGWGHAFAGFVILGWATSLPEVTISLSAVEVVGSPGMAAGNITGSVIFNLAILALLNLTSLKWSSTRQGDAGLTSLGAFNLVMLGSMLLLTLRPELLPADLAAVSGLWLLVVYAGSTLASWLGSRRAGAEVAPDLPPAGPEARACLLWGGVILVAGLWLTRIGDDLGRTYALEEGLVGTIFLASVSSLPELVTGWAAVRMGLLTMAAASILGSNIFNMGILGACDLVYQAGQAAPRPLLVAAEDPRMAWNLGAGLTLTALALVALALRRRSKARLPLGAVSVAMLVIYLGALVRT